MARHETVLIKAKEWTEITLNNATSISFQNKSVGTSHVTPTVGSVAPTDKSGSTEVEKGFGGSGSFADLWPGATGANRVFVWRDTAGLMMVSHD